MVVIGDSMSNYIKKTKDGADYNPVVNAPIHAFTGEMKTYEEMARAPVTNIVSKFESSSILSMLDTRQKNYADISGMNLRMVCSVQNKTFSDDVVVVGERGNFYIVEIDGEKYSVNKACAIFGKVN